MEFTRDELQTLAGFVCERFKDLDEIVNDPKVTNPSFKKGAKASRDKLQTLNDKLEAYYR